MTTSIWEQEYWLTFKAKKKKKRGGAARSHKQRYCLQVQEISIETSMQAHNSLDNYQKVVH